MAYATVELESGVWGIEDGMVQCYLIEGEQSAVLFDSCASGGVTFKETVADLSSKPTQLLISHSDGDHTGGQEYFVQTAMHTSELSLYARKGNDVSRARCIWEGAIYDLGGMELEVVLLPGHTPGSIALLDRANRRLFAGDSISDKWIYIFGDGRSLEAFIASMKKLEAMVPLFDRIYCCHGNMVLGAEWVHKVRVAAEKLLAGELVDNDPPVAIPARSYSYDGVVFFA